MKIDPLNPWQTNISGTICQTYDGDDRIRKIRATHDVAWLRKVVAWKNGNQKTVQDAAERRLRMLTKEAA